MLTRLPMKKINFCGAKFDATDSKTLKVAPVVKIAFAGRSSDMPTIMMGKIEMEFPAMYMMNKFIGI